MDPGVRTTEDDALEQRIPPLFSNAPSLERRPSYESQASVHELGGTSDLATSKVEVKTSAPALNGDAKAFSAPQTHDPTSDPEPKQTQKALQVLGSFFTYMNSWGLLNSYGVFQAYYTLHLIPSEPESNVALI